MSKLEVRPIELRDANAFVTRLHRHHGRLQIHKFSLAAWKDGVCVGVAIVMRPANIQRDDGMTLEVARLCTDGTKNACSFLYNCAARVAREMGYKKIGTYILGDEPGTSLRAAGWVKTHENQGSLWTSNNPARKHSGKSQHPIGPKHYYERNF